MRPDPDIHDVVLTTEEEGVGLVAGAGLGGQRAALLMQSSGVGNCINMFSLLQNCGFPCLVLVTMRGEFGEFNPWQVPMGSITEESLKLAGFLTYRVDNADEVDDIVGAGADMAFAGDLSVAILLSQRLIGRKEWTDDDGAARHSSRPCWPTAAILPWSSAGSARRPMTSPPPATIRSISICGAPWAAPR